MRTALAQERHGDGGAHRNKLAGERQLAGMRMDLEGRHRVTLLIAGEKEPPRRVDRETAWIVGVGPGFAHPCQFAAGAHRKLGDGVVPARGCVNEPTVRRDRKFRAQVAASEASLAATCARNLRSLRTVGSFTQPRAGTTPSPSLRWAPAAN